MKVIMKIFWFVIFCMLREMLTPLITDAQQETKENFAKARAERIAQESMQMQNYRK